MSPLKSYGMNVGIFTETNKFAAYIFLKSYGMNVGIFTETNKFAAYIFLV
jgi:Mg2+ and Co2+ transporter CorA